MAVDNNSVNWCAAKELCICKAAAATTRHLCPVRQGCVHAICGKICEDESILYHTTVMKVFFLVTRGPFESPESFRRRFITVARKDYLQDDNDEEGQVGASTSIDAEVDEVAQVSHMNSAIMRAHKVKKRHEFIKKLMLAQVSNEGRVECRGFCRIFSSWEFCR